MEYVRFFETSSKSEIVGIKIAFNRVGLRYRVLFENTLDMAASYGTGSRGAILEVVKDDLEVAEAILLDMGLQKIERPEEKESDFIIWYDKFSQKIPVISDMDLSFRLIILIIVVAIVAMGILLPLTLVLADLRT